MIWESDSLLEKAKLYFERAFQHRSDDSLFGLWCSLGLELLARAAVAAVSPTLLAEPDREQKNLLHALGEGPALTSPKSIASAQVISHCQVLSPDFTKEDATAVSAMINRRNAELHSAEAAFEDYPSKQWLPGFYRACRSLTKGLGSTLDDLFGIDEATIANDVLKQSKESAVGKVASSIAAHKRVFESRSEDDRLAASEEAQKRMKQLVFERHHRVLCPACGSAASVEGIEFGGEKVSHGDGAIEVARSVSPNVFTCFACGLKFQGYAELDAAGFGGTYTRTSSFSPEEYYGLIDPNSPEMSEHVNRFLVDMAEEYDNE